MVPGDALPHPAVSTLDAGAGDAGGRKTAPLQDSRFRKVYALADG
jgi:hypothetical protein